MSAAPDTTRSHLLIAFLRAEAAGFHVLAQAIATLIRKL